MNYKRKKTLNRVNVRHNPRRHFLGHTTIPVGQNFVDVRVVQSSEPHFLRSRIEILLLGGTVGKP